MRNLKTFAIALAIMLCSNAFAGSNSNPEKGKNSKSYEVRKLLKDGILLIENDQRAKVVFSLDEERKIIIHAVLCGEKEVSDFIAEKLKGKKLFNPQLEVGKVYLLPLQLKAVK